MDTLDYKNDQVPVGQFRYDLAGWDVGTGWKAFMPMKNLKADTVVITLRKHRRYDEKLKKVVSDSANEIMQAARAQNADEAPLTPYRPQGNRLEREIETVGDSLKAQFEHSRCIAHLRPFVSLFVSDIHNLFGKVTRYYKAKPSEGGSRGRARESYKEESEGGA